MVESVAQVAPRLAKVLGMLGSSHDGEVLAAAKKAQGIVKGAGLTWQELFLPALEPPAKTTRPEEPGSAAEMVARCLDRVEMLSDKELDFLRNIHERLADGGTISAKQHKWLCDIHEKVAQS